MLQHPTVFTFTGIDEQTDPVALQEFAKTRNVEFGVLFSNKRQGNDPRYPSMKYIRDLRLHNLRLSAHLCGTYADEVNEGRDIAIDLHGFTRVQINHVAPNVDNILRLKQRYPHIGIVAQCRGDSFPLDDRIDWLHDASGGRGVETAVYPVAPQGRYVGFAGGISPTTVQDVVARINPVKYLYWLDCESGIRTDDRFDLAKCQGVLDGMYEALA